MLQGMIRPVIPAVITRVATMGPRDVMLDIWADLQIPAKAKASHEAIKDLLLQSERVISSRFRGILGVPDLSLLCSYDLSKVLCSAVHPGLILICVDPAAGGEHAHIRHTGAVFETSNERDAKRLIENVERWGNIFRDLLKMFPKGQFSLVAIKGGLKAEEDVQEAMMEKGNVSIRVSENQLEAHATDVAEWRAACIKHLRSFLS